MTKLYYISPSLFLLAFFLFVTSCSSTSGLEEGEQLYTGLKKINYADFKSDTHSEYVKAEVEAALAANCDCGCGMPSTAILLHWAVG